MPISTDSVDALVVGAGIAGLVAALELANAGRTVRVWEASEQPGGMLRQVELDGLVLDAGAEAFATRSLAVADLISDFELDVDVVHPAAASAHLVRGRRRVRRDPLPRNTVLGLPAQPWAADVRRTIGWLGAVRAVIEPALPAVRPVNESLDALVRRRFGRRVADRLVTPVCRGVYSTPPTELTLERVAPGVAERLRETGSLRLALEQFTSSVPPGAAVASIEGGMWRLADALVGRLAAHGVRIETGTRAKSVHPSDDAVDVTGVSVVDSTRTEQRVHARTVVWAAGARVLPAQLRPELPEAEQVHVTTVVLDAPALDAHPLGSGALVAPEAIREAKAITHSNAKWAWIAKQLAAGRQVLRLSAERAHPDWTADADAVAAEIRHLTGADVSAPSIRAMHSTVWPSSSGALEPAVARELEARLRTRGVRVVGADVAGTGITAIVPHARAAARELIDQLSIHPEPMRSHA